MQKFLCNVQKFRRNAIHNVWLAMSKKWKSTVDFMVFHPTDKIPSILQLHQGQKLKRWQVLHKKSIVRETNFHIWNTWFIRRHYLRHCTILGRNHICSHLVHSRRVHILGDTTECNVALDQCSCNKTSGIVFCVSKDHKPLGESLTYHYWRWILYLLRLASNFSCRKVEWIDLPITTLPDRTLQKTDKNCGTQPMSFGIRMFVHAVEWLLHISSTINHQSRICVVVRLGSTNMTEIYGYALREIKICWTEFWKLSYLIAAAVQAKSRNF